MTSNAMGNLAASGLRAFADWAVNNDTAEKTAFRKDAAVNLREAISKSTLAMPALTEDEIEFCSGWIFFARQDLGVDDPAKLDAHLVERARATLADGQIHVMNG
jgi:hypothetical protein